ncbi:hypothetical protein AV530_003206 [Patagioenas fasciata monilis]|uniref:Uncharacterized protein n=1 Tax=Patagioenas fasciata monilis TaxID=372326 RepID=A0A1V4KWH5_PATFA|nr:hypothetical protein AV530_003206 [Patagioenas fasciata monilis]
MAAAVAAEPEGPAEGIEIRLIGAESLTLYGGLGGVGYPCLYMDILYPRTIGIVRNSLRPSVWKTVSCCSRAPHIPLSNDCLSVPAEENAVRWGDVFSTSKDLQTD